MCGGRLEVRVKTHRVACEDALVDVERQEVRVKTQSYL